MTSEADRIHAHMWDEADEPIKMVADLFHACGATEFPCYYCATTPNDCPEHGRHNCPFCGALDVSNKYPHACN